MQVASRLPRQQTPPASYLYPWGRRAGRRPSRGSPRCPRWRWRGRRWATRTGSGCCRCCRARRRRASACRRCACCCLSEPAAAARGGRLGCLGAVTKVFHMRVFWSLILKFPQKGTQGSTFPAAEDSSRKASPCRPHDRATSSAWPWGSRAVSPPLPAAGHGGPASLWAPGALARRRVTYHVLAATFKLTKAHHYKRGET